MLILEYISTHGTPEWCAARMSARESKAPSYCQKSWHYKLHTLWVLTRGQPQWRQLCVVPMFVCGMETVCNKGHIQCGERPVKRAQLAR